MEITHILATFFAAILGLSFGSFLNVCLSRWPRNQSIVAPASHCPNCGHVLSWWENIPVLSWIFLRARCRNCRTAISWRYPLVELLVAALWAYQGWHFAGLIANPLLPSSVMIYLLIITLGKMFFFWLLVALAFLDAENFWLPDKLTLSGTAIGLIFSISAPFIWMRLDRSTRLPFTDGFQHLPFANWSFILYPVAAVLGSAGIILLIRWLYWLVRRKEGMGLGDAKLMAMLAAWLGLPCALLSLFMGVSLGAVYAIFLLFNERNRNEMEQEAFPAPAQNTPLKEKWAVIRLPLGTFLCIGGAVSSIIGERIIALYLRWAGF